MASGYSYRPLDPDKREIRLLCFRAQDTFSPQPLEAYIEHISLLDEDENLPRYAAISYAWGDISIRKPIMIDGLTVSIPINAEVALRYLNYNPLSLSQRILERLRVWAGLAGPILRIWIDSVCVNQPDLDERNSQVAMMGKVYSKAYSVWIWLGEDVDGTAKVAMKSLRSIYIQAREMTENFENVREVLHGRTVKQDYGVPGWSKYTNRDKVSPTGILCPVDAPALDNFFSAAWFSRVWVLQEAILSKRAYCFKGREVCDWRQVIIAARWILYLRHQETPDLALNVNIARARQMFDHWIRFDEVLNASDPALISRYLEDLLAIAAGFHASDERDKVFAILPFLGQYPHSLAPDYRLSVTEVFTRACRAAIVGGKSLNLAIIAQSVVRGEDGPEVRLPSWVLTFRHTADQEVNVSIINGNASCAPGCADLFDQDNAGSGSILKVRGFLVDEVKCEPRPRQLFRKLQKEHLLELREVWLTATTHLTSYSAKFLVNDLFTTLSAGEPVMVEDPPVDRYRAEIGFRGFMSRAVNLTAVEKEIDATETDFTAANISLWRRSRNRCFFVTRDNRIGTGTPQTRRGDQICILFGAPAPVILRPEGEYWTLVGDAYVNGIMNGEFLDQLHRDGRFENEIRSFDIQ